MKLSRILGSLGAALILASAAEAQQARQVTPPQRSDPKAGSEPLGGTEASPYRSDIAVKGGITIGSGSGVSAPWGSTINIPGSLGKMVGLADCSFDIAYTVQNLGPITTGAFTDRLVANSGSWWYPVIQPGPVLSKGASQTMHTKLKLLPYNGNTVSLQLDVAAQVSELNENNNKVQVQVTVSGPCQKP
jgi:hypothetical protein